LFETNWLLDVPVLRPPPPRQAKMGRPPKNGEAIQVVGHFSDVPAGRRALGIEWMNQRELAEAIPPAYTELIGHQLLQHLAYREARVG
jgi:DNA (cytosine-5)-methyltransferase 1